MPRPSVRPSNPTTMTSASMIMIGEEVLRVPKCSVPPKRTVLKHFTVVAGMHIDPMIAKTCIKHNDNEFLHVKLLTLL